MPEPDVTVEDHGTIYLFRCNAKARAELLPSTESWQWMGDALAVEHRYAPDVAARLTENGFVVVRA